MRRNFLFLVRRKAKVQRKKNSKKKYQILWLNESFFLQKTNIFLSSPFFPSPTVCNQFSRGVFSMLGAVSPDSFDTLHSYSNTFQMPFVTPWFPEKVSKKKHLSLRSHRSCFFFILALAHASRVLCYFSPFLLLFCLCSGWWVLLGWSGTLAHSRYYTLDALHVDHH